MLRTIVAFLLSFFLLDSYAVNMHPKPDTITLTFDDGPSSKHTQKILDILDHYHIKATFFVIAKKAKRYPNSIKIIKARCHVIANHSMTYPFLTHLNEERLRYEVAEPNVVVKNITGKIPICLQPLMVCPTNVSVVIFVLKACKLPYGI